MAGVKALRVTELAHEDTSTPGTWLEATTRWRGTGMIKDNMVTVFVPEDIGNYGGSTNTYIQRYGGEIVVEQDANFTQINYPLQAGIVGPVAGVADDSSGSVYTYTYTMPTTAQNEFATYSFTAGDDTGAEKLSYCFVPNFSLTGTAGEALQLSATFRGQQVEPATLSDTAVVPVPVDYILMSMGALWIDDDTAVAIATTAISNSLIGMTLDVNTGLQEVFAASGTKKFAFVKRVQPEITLQLTFEHDASSIAQKVKWRAGTACQIRLNFTGSAVTTPGQYDYNLLQIDMAGKWDTWDVIGENNGNDIVTGTFRAKYSADANAAAGLFCTFLVVMDGLATLP